jgi:hypothetical protein
MGFEPSLRLDHFAYVLTRPAMSLARSTLRAKHKKR